MVENIKITQKIRSRRISRQIHSLRGYKQWSSCESRFEDSGHLATKTFQIIK